MRRQRLPPEVAGKRDWIARKAGGYVRQKKAPRRPIPSHTAAALYAEDPLVTESALERNAPNRRSVKKRSWKANAQTQRNHNLRASAATTATNSLGSTGR